MSNLRSLPSVDRLLQTSQAADLVTAFGRPLTLAALRSTLEHIRLQGVGDNIPEMEKILEQAAKRLDEWLEPTLITVINASGVILHTNLGRAPLSQAATQAIQTVSEGYSSLEFNLGSGRRGNREVHAQVLLNRLTGAEAALVVNNNAAAVLLCLSALARRRVVIISRTQLVEIGGGFRIPDVMKQSGARLIEIGTTNRVHLRDYEEALQNHPAALVMRAHHSNFRIVGFSSEPPLAEITALAHRYDVPILDDLGSGAVLDSAEFGLAHEPTVQESLACGVDLVCFSGDKLLGGPQAGIILGSRKWVEKINKHPLARAIRADKLCLAALAATLLHYVKDEALSQVPIWRMIAMGEDEIRQRASTWRQALGQGEVVAGLSTVGGGSLPEETLPTWLLALDVKKPDQALAALRQQRPVIVARIQDDRLALDPRTVLPEQEDALLAGLRRVIIPSSIPSGGPAQ